MLNLITSFLIQTGSCILPGIGTFSLIKKPAFLDVANKEISPPEIEYRFSETYTQPESGLIQYISNKKNIDGRKALLEIKDLCKSLKEKLDTGEKIHFNSIGSLVNSSSGKLLFEPQENSPFYQAVPAIRVVHKEVKHAMLVGDKETDSTAMNEILNGNRVQQNGHTLWKIAAVILFIIATGILIVHFYTSTSVNPFGNGNKVAPQEQSNTYILP